jgi:hypothetical protein
MDEQLNLPHKMLMDKTQYKDAFTWRGAQNREKGHEYVFKSAQEIKVH